MRSAAKNRLRTLSATPPPVTALAAPTAEVGALAVTRPLDLLTAAAAP
ncbi:hypothetical protein [Streptomyces leeuwenhoekii]|nr:hypothetical protein [Streptomyces leeuwenhoekii]